MNDPACMTAAPSVELTALDAVRPRAVPPSRGEGPLRLAAALALHLALLAALLWLGAAPILAPPEEPAVEAEVIGARDFDALRRPLPPAPPAAAAPAPEAVPVAPPAAAAPPVPAAPRPDDMIRPSRMLSEAALDNPRSTVRRALARLAEEERIAQLCDLEAMEQIHAWQPGYQPDRLVDYARADTRMNGTTLTAGGGAFRSRLKWYEVSYRCELDAAMRKVVAFAFKVGEPIPREEWSSLNLPALH